ncbi:MAG: hypothetical protein PVI37_03750 [Gammaproteobacteria bacterium]|jgi:hypothetical protein
MRTALFCAVMALATAARANGACQTLAQHADSQSLADLSPAPGRIDLDNDGHADDLVVAPAPGRAGRQWLSRKPAGGPIIPPPESDWSESVAQVRGVQYLLFSGPLGKLRDADVITPDGTRYHRCRFHAVSELAAAGARHPTLCRGLLHARPVSGFTRTRLEVDLNGDGVLESVVRRKARRGDGSCATSYLDLEGRPTALRRTLLGAQSQILVSRFDGHILPSGCGVPGHSALVARRGRIYLRVLRRASGQPGTAGFAFRIGSDGATRICRYLPERRTAWERLDERAGHVDLNPRAAEVSEVARP